MKDQIIFVVRENDSLLTRAYKKVRLANAMIVGLLLVTKLYNALVEIEEKNQKGE